MDIQTIDQEYQQLQTQAQETIGEIKDLAGKLSAAAQGGNQDAKEWLLDLKSVALAIQAEQNQVGLLLQALHGFVANQAQAMIQAPAQQAGPWGSPAQGPPPGSGYPGGFGAGPVGGGVGGMLGNFLNSGFGRALEMGAGFGIGSDLINQIF
ncbi:MAG: hypothetical protein M0002_11495 [Rhodospirillales bacterium]|nr:hypothetical protein [Rhodospirillales bacterium]